MQSKWVSADLDKKVLAMTIERIKMKNIMIQKLKRTFVNADFIR